MFLLHAQVVVYKNMLKITCWLFAFTLYKTFLRNKNKSKTIIHASFLHNFWINIFLLLYSVNWPNLTAWLSLVLELLPNRHIFVDSTPVRRRISTWKVHGNYFDSERSIHMESMTLIRGGYFDIDSTFKIDEILMSSPREFFYVILMSNRRNFCAPCFHSIIF